MTAEQNSLTGKLIIGIDLGTTNSSVSVWDPEQQAVRVLKNSEDEQLTPSVVGWDPVAAEWVVGQAAQVVSQTHPERVAYSIKRYIGRWFSDPQVLYGRQQLNYELISGGGVDQLRDVVVHFGSAASGEALHLTAPSVSAKILAKLRQDAADHLQLPLAAVQYAVITVPAYFNYLQRRATTLAGREAGLEVVDILNEPTAAALAYSDLVVTGQEKRILVFDLGGGTFDISLLEISRDEMGYLFFTRVVDGDTRLGGDDVDQAVLNWMCAQIEAQTGSVVRPDDKATREKLRQAAEQAKVALTSASTVTLSLPQIDLGNRQPFDISLTLTQAQLEQCAADLIERSCAIMKRAVFEVAQLTWADIDNIVMVGGQTLMPALQTAVAQLTGLTPRVNDRPQLAVAEGAGKYGHVLSLGESRFHENALVNVLALALGIRLDEDTFEPIVAANVTVPHTSKPFAVTTTEDNQTRINIEILQGPFNAKTAADCVLLGHLEMEVPAAPARTLRFDVVFDVLSDGTMKVLVTDLSRNRTAELDIVETRRALVWRNKTEE